MRKLKCPQTKCVFNQIGGCQACSICKCEPNVIDENCDKCWNCAKDSGVLRWNFGEAEVEAEAETEKKIELKPIEVKA